MLFLSDNCIYTRPDEMDRLRKEEEMKVGKCPICGGDTKEDVVEVQEMIEGVAYIIKGVKAEVCVQCGERMYSLNEMRRIEKVREKIRNRMIKPIEVRKVAVVGL